MLLVTSCPDSKGSAASGSTTEVPDSDGDAVATSSTSTSAQPTSETSGDTSSSGSSSSSTAGVGSSSSSSGDDGSSTGTPPPGNGCPDELPAEWILCEDFERFAGWGNFWTNGGAMAVEQGPASSGDHSLRISHIVGQFGSGMADLRFGAGPGGGVVHHPEETYREVWVRFFLRTHEDWHANAGISEGIEVLSVVGGNRSIAVDATVYSPSTAEAQLIAWSCVHDSEMRCSSGNGDWNNPDLRALSAALGPSPLFGNEQAGQWQCHEMHVKLDDPGQANGEVDFWADGNTEVELDGLEFVGSWDGAGLNTVRFASFWQTQVGLDHHVDDVIVSTAPIGCP